MLRVMTSIGLVGAPDVEKRYCVLKVLRHWSMTITDTRSVVGFNSGNVMYQKSCHEFHHLVRFQLGQDARIQPQSS